MLCATALAHPHALLYSSCRYDDLLSAMGDHKDALEKALFQANEFEELYAGAMDWMGRTNDRLKGEGPIHSELDEVKQQVEDHKVCMYTEGAIGHVGCKATYVRVYVCVLCMYLVHMMLWVWKIIPKSTTVALVDCSLPSPPLSPPCNAGVAEGA